MLAQYSADESASGEKTETHTPKRITQKEHLIPAPFRRSHMTKANPLRGNADQKQHRYQFAALDRHAVGQG
jgi:hypothetical protein